MTAQVQGQARTPFDAALSLGRLKRGESYTLRIQIADDRSRYDGASVRFTLANAALRVDPGLVPLPDLRRRARLTDRARTRTQAGRTDLGPYSADVLAEQDGAE